MTKRNKEIYKQISKKCFFLKNVWITTTEYFFEGLEGIFLTIFMVPKDTSPSSNSPWIHKHTNTVTVETGLEFFFFFLFLHSNP